MKKMGILLAVMLVMGIATVSATNVDVTWNGSGEIDASISNDLSETSIYGESNNYAGKFHGHDGSYGRVEGGAEASFDNGGEYYFTQWNDLKKGESYVHAGVYSNDEGIIDVKGDNWRTGNSLYTNGHGKHDWAGTDSPVVKASGSNYWVGIDAGYDEDEDGEHDSTYSSSIVGDGEAGIGTWKAGSNSVLKAGNKISGKVMVKGEGSANWNQVFDNTGDIEGEYTWG